MSLPRVVSTVTSPLPKSVCRRHIEGLRLVVSVSFQQLTSQQRCVSTTLGLVTIDHCTTIPGGLVVRIRRSHRRGPGSIPGQGTVFWNLLTSISYNKDQATMKIVYHILYWKSIYNDNLPPSSPLWPSSSFTLQNTKSPLCPGWAENSHYCCEILNFIPLKCTVIYSLPTCQKHHKEMINFTIIITITVYVTLHLL